MKYGNVLRQLPIEPRVHITMKDFSVSIIDQQFIASIIPRWSKYPGQKIRYKLADFSICTQKHFYAILTNNGQYHKYDNTVSTSCTSLTNSYRFTTWHFPPFERAQRQDTSSFVGNSARGYSGKEIPIMVSPDIGNATCNGTSPVANNSTVSSVL